MITWLKEIFTKGEAASEITPEPEAAVLVKDIGEPVLSFVQCVKDNPKRFKLHALETINNKTCFKLKDSLYGQEFSFCLYYYNSIPCICDISVSFLTSDERTYLCDNLRTVFADKYDKRNKLLRIRADRSKEKEREAMKKIYCEK